MRNDLRVLICYLIYRLKIIFRSLDRFTIETSHSSDEASSRLESTLE